jgi:hypothetical protein
MFVRVFFENYFSVLVKFRKLTLVVSVIFNCMCVCRSGLYVYRTAGGGCMCCAQGHPQSVLTHPHSLLHCFWFLHGWHVFFNVSVCVSVCVCGSWVVCMTASIMTATTTFIHVSWSRSQSRLWMLIYLEERDFLLCLLASVRWCILYSSTLSLFWIFLP